MTGADLREQHSRYQELVHSVRLEVPVCKHDDLSSDPQRPHKRPGMSVPIIPALQRQRQDPWELLTSLFAKSVSSRLGEIE